MKVKTIKKGYYGGKIRKVGEIFDYNEIDKKLPSWLTSVVGLHPAYSDFPLSLGCPHPTDKKQIDVQTKKSQTEADNAKKLTDSDKQQYLDLLINEGIEKNILIENTDKKSIDEQINELETALKENK